MSDLVKVVEINGVEYLVIEDKPVEPIEFRLYYDELGRVLFYTSEKPEGNYITVDQQVYSEMRYDWKVVDGKLTKLIPGVIISKLMPKDEGQLCAKEDMSIIVPKSYKGKKQQWKLVTYELE